MKLLQLLPIGNVDEGLIVDMCHAMEAILGIPCKVLPDRLDPEFAFHRERQQYHSSEILQRMQSFVNATPGECWALQPWICTSRFLRSSSAKHK
ncbi:MAG: hypothetical protein WBF04_00040 [Candidatus Sulfotelmatobacter sp.]